MHKYFKFEVKVSFDSLKWWNDKWNRLPTGEPLPKRQKVDPCTVEAFMRGKFQMVEYNKESFHIIVSIEKDMPLFDLISIARRLISIYGTANNNDILHKIITATDKAELLSHLDYIFQYVLEEDAIKVVFGPIERHIKRQLDIEYKDEKTVVVSSLDVAPKDITNNEGIRLNLSECIIV